MSDFLGGIQGGTSTEPRHEHQPQPPEEKIGAPGRKPGCNTPTGAQRQSKSQEDKVRKADKNAAGDPDKGISSAGHRPKRNGDHDDD